MKINAVCVNVAEWIAKRLMTMEERQVTTADIARLTGLAHQTIRDRAKALGIVPTIVSGKVTGGTVAIWPPGTEERVMAVTRKTTCTRQPGNEAWRTIEREYCKTKRRPCLLRDLGQSCSLCEREYEDAAAIRCDSMATLEAAYTSTVAP